MKCWNGIWVAPGRVHGYVVNFAHGESLSLLSRVVGPFQID